MVSGTCVGRNELLPIDNTLLLAIVPFDESLTNEIFSGTQTLREKTERRFFRSLCLSTLCHQQTVKVPTEDLTRHGTEPGPRTLQDGHSQKVS